MTCPILGSWLAIASFICIFSFFSQADAAPAAWIEDDTFYSETTSGWYLGHQVPQRPNVTEFLGLRYAQAPVGDLRFAAPVPYVSKDTFQASVQPPDCPYVADKWGSVPGEVWSHASRIMAQESADGYNAMSEDCLMLNVWAPNQSPGKKPVMVFLYGGGFDRGSVNNPMYIGANMAAAQDVVVVTLNYRVNIMGLANAPESDSNVALRDIRLALEWVQRNIAAFDGDADHIALFGQSQGAWLLSAYAYAFPDDPIASAFIQQSESAFSTISSTLEYKAEIWRNASRAVGCANSTDAAVLKCMRALNLSTVLAAWNSAPATTFTGAPFGPAVDNQLVFANYTQRTLEKRFANKPFLMGSNANEAGFYVFRFGGLNQTDQDLINYNVYGCPVAADAAAKAAAGATVYRYRYSGDWPNLALYPTSGAYHTSETSVIFGTMEDVSGDPNTELEVKVSEYMQSAWATLARDGEDGLKMLGWPRYDPEGRTLIRLGYEAEETASFVLPSEVDGPCKTAYR